jgi:hypothetical protein
MRHSFAAALIVSLNWVVGCASSTSVATPMLDFDPYEKCGLSADEWKFVPGQAPQELTDGLETSLRSRAIWFVGDANRRAVCIPDLNGGSNSCGAQRWRYEKMQMPVNPPSPDAFRDSWRVVTDDNFPTNVICEY